MPQIHSQSLNLYTLFYSIRRRLNETTATYWTDLEIYAWLNEGQSFIVDKTKCLKKEITITTTDGTQEYDLRTTTNDFSDIIDIAKDGVYFYQNGSIYSPIEERTKEQLNIEIPGWQGATSGIPQYYYYNKASKTIGLYPKPNSSNAGAYLFINGYYKPKIINAGTAAAGSTSSITLAAGSSTIPYPNVSNDYYNNLYVEIYQNTGAGQKVKITDYVGSTRVCSATFTTAPDTTSIYGMIPEIPEEMHFLMELYGLAKAFEKGGSRTTLANNYWQQLYSELLKFITEYLGENSTEFKEIKNNINQIRRQ